MSKKVPMALTSQEQINKRGFLDSLVYWLTQLGLAALAVSGILFFLQPVSNAISYPISGLLVALMLYISYKNR